MHRSHPLCEVDEDRGERDLLFLSQTTRSSTDNLPVVGNGLGTSDVAGYVLHWYCRMLDMLGCITWLAASIFHDR